MEAEVVSADSMQAYRGMDIGTAKPDRELRSRIPHWLLDIRDPDEQYNAGDFVRLADEACADIASRGKFCIVSGGTGFYAKNFVLGPSDAPPSDPAVRAGLQAELSSRGVGALRAELEAADPVSAGRIHGNDIYRTLRALEVFRCTGRPLSSFSEHGATPVDGSTRPAYRFLVVALSRPREELYRRIELRCAAMFRSGLRSELERLVAAGYGPGDPGLVAIGYREFFREDGSLCDDDAAVMEAVIRDTRRYAKRQETFFSPLPGLRRLEAGADVAATASALAKLVDEELRRT